MNSTRRYSVRKIVSHSTCFVVSLELVGGFRRWIFPNAEWMDEPQKAIGVEVAEADPHAALGGFFPRARADFRVSGKCVVETETPGKISFRLEDSPLLGGNHVLLCPSWGRRTAKRMWLLIPTSGKKRGQ